MANSTDLIVNIIGNAQSAVQAFNDVGDAAGKQQATFSKVRAGVTVASAAMVAGVAAFATDSVAAFSEAQQSQAQLQAAYEKFPAVTSVSIDALRSLNTEVQRKTGFDDDALAASQATLAQFGLTGEQIQQLTPLMADYAAKTGKGIEDAATVMGKAVMGQGKALKGVGIDFADAGSAGANFDQLISGLDGTVGGFATTMGDTAAGKAQILAQSFGDIQETVGELLIPALTWLTDVATQVTQWLSDNPAIVQAAAIAIGVLTVAIIALNVALWASTSAILANPITWITLAVVALAAAVVALALNWDAVVAWLSDVWSGFVGWLTAGLAALGSWWSDFWGRIGRFLSDAWQNWIVTPIRAAVDWIRSFVVGGLTLLQTGWESTWTGIGSFVKGIWNNIVGWIEGGVNGAIDLINGLTSGIRDVAELLHIDVGVIPHVRIPRLAAGTVTSGPMLALIGDNPGGREVVQPVSTYQDELRRAYTTGQQSGGRSSSGVVRLHPDDIQSIIKGLHTSIVTGAQRTVLAAL